MSYIAVFFVLFYLSSTLAASQNSVSCSILSLLLLLEKKKLDV